MTTGGVSDQVCDERHEGLTKLCVEKHANIERRFETLETAVAEALTKISEATAGTNRLLEFVIEQGNREAKSSKVWHEPWFKYPVIVSSLIVLLLAIAAIGGQIMDSIPWIEKAYEMYKGQ